MPYEPPHQRHSAFTAEDPHPGGVGGKETIHSGSSPLPLSSNTSGSVASSMAWKNTNANWTGQGQGSTYNFDKVNRNVSQRQVETVFGG